MDLPVTDDGIRPAGRSDQCFYCQAPKGQHQIDCVCVKKAVLIRTTVEYLVSVPRSWSKENVEFHRNESTFCQGNMVGELEIAKENGDCLCMSTQTEYLRDATKADMTSFPLGFLP